MEDEAGMDDPGQTRQGDEERGSHKRSDKRPEEVEAVPSAVVLPDAEIELVGGNEKPPAQDSQAEEDDKGQDFRKFYRNGQAEQTEKQQKAGLDDRQPPVGRAVDRVAEACAQNRTQHERGNQKSDPPN